MTFVKTPGEDPTQAASEAALEGLGSAAAKAAGEKVDKIVSAGQKALELAAGLKAAVTGGVAGAAAHEAGIIAEKLSIPGNLGVGLGGEIPGSAGGVISEGVGGNITGITGAGELPFFEEKAITSFTGGKGQSPFDGGGGGMIGDAAGTLQRKLGGKNLELEVASGDTLHVRNFSIQERLSSLFQVDLVVVSENHSIDFDAIVGQPAHFTLHGAMHERRWSGLCNHFEQVRVESTGVSTYRLSIVPTLWLLTQRKNYRMFQQLSEPDIVLELLKEWSIETDVRIDRGAYKKRKYRVQYAESDFAFVSRVLEDAGITFYFEQAGDETKLVLSDASQANPKRERPLLFLDNTSTVKSAEVEHATGVRMAQRVRPGKYTMRDHDYRQPPSYKLMSSASGGRGVEEKLERFHYTPGAFLFGSTQGDSSPVADDKGKTRSDEKEAGILAQKRLDAKRGSARVCTFETNALDLAPGVVLTMAGHPHAALGDGQKLLVVESSLSGTSKGEWAHHCEARGTEVPYRPDAVTPRPTVNGVESATVVGPGSEEIHCDEFGRVRVHFHWDRESKMNEDSSCWIHVSQAWGGSGYGGMNLPRVGQEVLVDFLGGDPDRPVIVGRMYTNLQKVPYKLPGNKTQSGLKSNSTGKRGGFNEIMFEDAGGQELLRMQAEKDLHKIVKNDEQHTVGRDRTRAVKRNETVTVGKNRTKHVAKNERVVVGHNQTVAVGGNRATQVGGIDSTLVGDTHVMMVSPPGEHGPAPSTSLLMKHEKFVLDTGAGAKITMTGSMIALEASVITFTAKDRLTVGSDGITIVGGATGLNLSSPKGEVAITGGPTVTINGPGMPSARLGDATGGMVLKGSATVLVGGPTIPFEVSVQGNGDIKVGDHITIKKGEGHYADFQAKVLRDLVIMCSTPSGLKRLQNIQNNPGKHDITIREYTEKEANNKDWGPNNSITSPQPSWWGHGQKIDFDSKHQPVPGSGSDSEIGYNPDIQTGPLGHPEPPDATLFHEMGHAEHNAYGINQADEKMGDGWHNKEEWQNIEGGVNKKDGKNNIPVALDSPSENDYLSDRGYPFRRTDHGNGYSNPDGSMIAP